MLGTLFLLLTVSATTTQTPPPGIVDELLTALTAPISPVTSIEVTGEDARYIERLAASDAADGPRIVSQTFEDLASQLESAEWNEAIDTIGHLSGRLVAAGMDFFSTDPDKARPLAVLIRGAYDQCGATALDIHSVLLFADDFQIAYAHLPLSEIQICRKNMTAIAAFLDSAAQG